MWIRRLPRHRPDRRVHGAERNAPIRAATASRIGGQVGAREWCIALRYMHPTKCFPSLRISATMARNPRSRAMADAIPSKDDLKAAFKAFKKRLKLTRLDAESNLNYRPTSTGKGSGIVAISPPNQFPQAVWDELVKQG